MKHAAISAAILASAATMAHANVSVRVDSSKESIEAKNFAKALLEKYEFSSLVDSHIKALSVAMRFDDEPLEIDVSTLVAAMEGADSTIQNIYDPKIASGCYGNCYTNCHGSRSWR